MSTLFSFHKVVLSVLVILSIASGCRKDIDFEQGENATTEGPINPANPILGEWERVGLIFNVQNLESDGNKVYFNRMIGGNGMYSLDTSGAIQYLFDISSTNDVSLIKYEAPILYYARSISPSSLLITHFDDNGTVQDYPLNCETVSGSRIESIIDLGPQLFVAGRFAVMSGPVASNSACFIDKATGDSIPIPGLFDRVEDAILFNNEIYVVGESLVNLNTGMAKWDGSQWLSVGLISGLSKILSIGDDNGQLIVGGDFYPDYRAINKFDPSTSLFESNSIFSTGSETGNNVLAKVKNYNGKLYAAGTFRFSNSSFRSLYELDNGNWRSIGALDMTATDFTICQGYAYVLADGKIFRYKL